MIEITSDLAPTRASALEETRPSFVKRTLNTITNIFVGDR